MDHLSITASAVGTSQVAIDITRELVAYAKHINNCSRDTRFLTEEGSILSTLLDQLRQHALKTQDKGFLGQHAGCVEQFETAHLDLAKTLNIDTSMLRKEASSIDAVDDTENIALIAAMERGLEKTVEFLIDDSALVDLHDDHGLMVLSMAEKGWKNATDILVQRLLPQIGRMDRDCGLATIGRLALFLAVEDQNGSMVDTLLHLGVNVNAKDGKGQTALFRAARRQDAPMTKLLLSHNIEIDSRDDEGRTAWSANVRSRNKEVLDLLLQAGADPSTRGLQGVSPLYEAASNGYAEMVRFLLESGTNPSIQTEYQWVPIHWAAAFGHEDCVKLLIDAGADVNARSDQDVTVLDLAAKANEKAIAKILKDAGATATSTELAQRTPETPRFRIEPLVPTPLSMSPASPLEHKLFLVFDNPLSRTLVTRTNFGQFLYPRVQQGSPDPAGYIYQVSHIMETTSNTIAVRRAVRRAKMHEYPLQVDDFNFTDVLYQITRLDANYQEFELHPGTQTALHEQPKSLATPQPTKYRMHKDWAGNWNVRLNSATSTELLFRTTPCLDVHSHSQDCYWMTVEGNLLARSGWHDGTPNMCIESGVEIGSLDLVVTCGIVRLWSERALEGPVEVEGASEDRHLAGKDT